MHNSTIHKAQFYLFLVMEIIVISKEDLEDLVQTSVNKALIDFFSEKEEKARTKEILTVKETARLLGVSELTVRTYITKGNLKAERIGRRIMIRKIAIDHALKEVKSLKYRR